MLRTISAWVAVAILTVTTVRYLKLIVQRKISSSPAAWSIGAVAITIGYAAYWRTRNPTWLGNIVNLIGAIEIWIVLATLLTVLKRSGQLAIQFDRFQIGCLIASGLILLWWGISGNAGLTYWFVQALMVISYGALVQKILKLRRNMDSLEMWAAICATGAVGLIPAWIDRDWYGVGNCVRTVVCSALTVGLMWRIEQHARHLALVQRSA